MKSCTNCGSYAINEFSHGRIAGIDFDLCDVCYWRTRAEKLVAILIPLMDSIEASESVKRSKDQWLEYDYMTAPRWMVAKRFFEENRHV